MRLSIIEGDCEGLAESGIARPCSIPASSVTPFHWVTPPGMYVIQPRWKEQHKCQPAKSYTQLSYYLLCAAICFQSEEELICIVFVGFLWNSKKINLELAIKKWRNDAEITLQAKRSKPQTSGMHGHSWKYPTSSKQCTCMNNLEKQEIHSCLFPAMA